MILNFVITVATDGSASKIDRLSAGPVELKIKQAYVFRVYY